MRVINVIDRDLKEDLIKQGYNLLRTINTNDKTIWVFEDTLGRFIFDINSDVKDKCFISDKLVMTF